MESATEYWTARALLDWQVEMGVDEAIGDTPVDRYALQEKAPKIAAVAKPEVARPAATPDKIDPVEVARTVAAAAQDLDGLHAALAAFAHCPLKDAARNLVFSGGTAGGDVMIISDPPDREEDRAGQSFVGRSGVLLDKMLTAIGLSRENNVYIAPVIPWNPPQDRALTPQEIAMMQPFLHRHIDLAAPKILVLMGNGPCQALLGKNGMTRLRGKWAEVTERPTVPIFSPAYLLANPASKRDAWADLLALKSRLKDVS